MLQVQLLRLCSQDRTKLSDACTARPRWRRVGQSVENEPQHTKPGARSFSRSRALARRSRREVRNERLWPRAVVRRPLRAVAPGPPRRQVVPEHLCDSRLTIELQLAARRRLRRPTSRRCCSTISLLLQPPAASCRLPGARDDSNAPPPSPHAPPSRFRASGSDAAPRRPLATALPRLLPDACAPAAAAGSRRCRSTTRSATSRRSP